MSNYNKIPGIPHSTNAIAEEMAAVDKLAPPVRQLIHDAPVSIAAVPVWQRQQMQTLRDLLRDLAAFVEQISPGYQPLVPRLRRKRPLLSEHLAYSVPMRRRDAA